MSNYIKLQQDILKAKDVQDTRGKRSPFAYGFTDDSVFVCVDGYYIVLIPKSVWYLDNEKVFSVTPLNNFHKLFMEQYDAISIYDTGISKKLLDGRKAKQFSSEKFDVYVDENNLKYFGKDVTEYQGINEKSPIYLYEYDRLVGIVCPVNMESRKNE